MSALVLSHVSKRFATSTGTKVAAVSDISLDVADGELVALLGASGCGKSTLLRLVAGFETADAGTIRLGGRTVSGDGTHVPPEERKVGIVFQSYALWPHMDVAHNVGYALEVAGVKGEAWRARVDAALATVGLSGYDRRRTAELSGGQRQRVALARCLAMDPAIVLLDEPLANLDVHLRASMLDAFAEFHAATRATMLYVTHDQAEAMTAADLIVVMNQGRIEQAGSPEEIYSRPRSGFVATFLGGANILSGKAVDSSRLDIGAGIVRCAEPLFAAGAAGAMSIRFHEIGVSARQTQDALPATVTRQTFLGSTRDLSLALADGTTLRASAPPDLAIPADAKVWVALPPDRCRPVLI